MKDSDYSAKPGLKTITSLDWELDINFKFNYIYSG